MIGEFIAQLLASFYNLTSFQVGDFNLADFAVNFQDSFLNSSFVFILQIISGIITIGLTIGAVILVRKQKEFNQKVAAQIPTAVEDTGGGLLQDQWDDILRHIDSPREGEWKFAVIEADTLTDNILKNYFPGDTMGERLMNIDKTKLLAIDDVWEAHKIRNRLAHDTNYFLRHAEALRAIHLFENALKELGVIV